MGVFRGLYRVLSAPFRRDMGFFLLMFLLASGVNIVMRSVTVSLASGLLWGMYGFVEVYLLCLVLSVLRGRVVRGVYKGVLVAYGALNFVSDIVISFIAKNDFTAFVGLILGTNVSESVEFLQHYMSFEIVLCLVLGFGALYMLWRVFERIKPNGAVSRLCVALVLVSGVGVGLASFGVLGDNSSSSESSSGSVVTSGSRGCSLGGPWGNIFVGKIGAIACEHRSNRVNLRDYFGSETLVAGAASVVGGSSGVAGDGGSVEAFGGSLDGLDLPENVMVVVGESLSRRFCSLYDYEKETFPLLSKLSDSSLVVFNNVRSGDIYTIENFKLIMSTFSSRETSRTWYECMTVQELASMLGYRSYWVSNHSETSIGDNIMSMYAKLCDSVLFVGRHNGGKYSLGQPYDEVLLEPVRGILSSAGSCGSDGSDSFDGSVGSVDSSVGGSCGVADGQAGERKMVFVHVMGSHPEFQDRYPVGRIVFTKEDYKDYPLNQRAVRAHHDNSLLYNDWIVNELFSMVEDKEAICFYFPDHGLDVYQTKVNYSGHARRGDLESEAVGEEIPFMVYASDGYRRKFPEVMERLYGGRDREFVTEDFIYFLMDVLGVRFADK